MIALEIINFLGSILILLVFTCVFCLLMTTDLGFGPIAYSAFFLGGISLIGLAGVVCLDWFHD